MSPKSLEEKCDWEEVNWHTAWKMGLRKHFLPFGFGLYYLKKDLNNGKPTFVGSRPYHIFLTLAPIVTGIGYGLYKFFE